MKKLNLLIMSILYGLLIFSIIQWDLIQHVFVLDIFPLALNLFSLLLLMITLSVLYLEPGKEEELDNSFLDLYNFDYYAIFLHSLLLLMNGNVEWNTFALIGKAIYFSMKSLLIYLVICNTTPNKLTTVQANCKRYSLGALYLSFGLALGSIFFPWMFEVTEGGIQVSSNSIAYSFFILLQLSMFICLLAIVITNKRISRKRKRNLLWSCIPTGFLFLLQCFSTNIEFILHFLSLNLIILFILNFYEKGMKIAKTDEALSEQEWESQQLKRKLLLSRIQPSFIFNTLSTIAHLTKSDQEMAYQTTVTFADYLRNNLDTLSNPGIIPFAKELEYIKGYVDIQSLCYREKLKVIYEIDTLDFSIPALSIVPFIKLSVTTGLATKVGGGYVLLKTTETDDNYCITIKDNGLGYLQDDRKEKNEEYFIMESIKERIENDVHGHCLFESTPGEGTTITITIRKEAAK